MFYNMFFIVIRGQIGVFTKNIIIKVEMRAFQLAYKTLYII